MSNRTGLKRWEAVFAGLVACMALAFLMVVFFLYSELQRAVTTPILADIAEQLSDEATVREKITSKLVTQDALDVFLQEDGAIARAAVASEDAGDRLGAVILLGEVGADAAPFVPLLVTALDDDDREVRRHAAYALGEIGPDAAVTLTRLREMAAAEHARVHPEAAKAVSKILDTSAPPE